jgi:hypothetical protein
LLWGAPLRFPTSPPWSDCLLAIASPLTFTSGSPLSAYHSHMDCFLVLWPCTSLFSSLGAILVIVAGIPGEAHFYVQIFKCYISS